MSPMGCRVKGVSAVKGTAVNPMGTRRLVLSGGGSQGEGEGDFGSETQRHKRWS